MTHLQLHSETPGEAIVLIAGCDQDLSETLASEIINLGHRAFRWTPVSSPQEKIAQEEWHVCICGTNLSTEERHSIALRTSEFTRLIQVGESDSIDSSRSEQDEVPADLTIREWKYLLRSKIEAALAAEQISDWQHRLESTLFRSLVARSEPMQELCRELFSISGSDAPLVFRSESGVDSREVAWCVHESSSRSRSAFLTIDCAGFSSDAFETELFDDVPSNGSAGLLESLDGGTIHLKNVQTLSKQTQKKLIRFLESPAVPRGESFSLRYINLRWIVSCERQEAPTTADPLLNYLQARNDVRIFDYRPCENVEMICQNCRERS